MTDFTLHQGDCLAVMRVMPDASVDSIVTDPPYHLTQMSRGAHAATDAPAMPHGRHRIGDKGFMGKLWDGGDIAQRVEMWAECLRVLKPGGYLLAFSGSRTYHRMVCAIEDAGFEIRDQIMWIYGSGFPKSRNLSKYDMDGADAGVWKGWGTALKPAHEPIVMARKPLAEDTIAANVLRHGTGAINIDGCRVSIDEDLRAGAGSTWAKMHEGEGRAGEQSARRTYVERHSTDFSMTPGPRGGASFGRYPANIIHDGSDEVRSAFPHAAGQQGDLVSHGRSRQSPNGIFGGMRPALNHPARNETDKSAARFFYCAKTSRTDRNEGCEQLSRKPLHWSSGDQNPGSFQSEGTDKTSENNHPTVKPTDLMAYLCRMVTPPGGVVLDPFMGSGSTGKACIREGFEFIGIELDADYLAIARARIDHERRLPKQSRMFA